MFSELIKNFERVRRYLREFLVYGFRTREEVGSRSARSYDNERRRLESWLGDFMSFRRTASGKAVFFAADSRQLAHNPLYAAFKAKSFTPWDITLHFYLLDLLAGGDLFPSGSWPSALARIIWPALPQPPAWTNPPCARVRFTPWVPGPLTAASA